ncbi:malate Na(+) symporter [Klebsiella michiganensis]|uniref:Malate Na(+) symporter n=1 Tax=Klebsiella michiganensis TaxID=1134687 RepID=A0A7H4M058_9ENTR|nr:malate Na(+) symporter [Klebsiella michiganensis]
MSTTDNAFSATIDPINTPKPALKQRWWHILDNWKVGIIRCRSFCWPAA